MSKRTAFSLFLIVLGSLALPTAALAQAPKQLHKPKSKQRTPAPPPLEFQELDVPPQPPPPPPTPEQLPAGPVVVTYQNSQLTIDAHNSALSDILRVVSRTTGALVEVPEDADERVFGQIGPGAVRDVLASLLNGTKFNYVMLGTADNPNALAQIVLTPKPAGNANDRGPTQQTARAFAPVQQPVVQPPAAVQPPAQQPEPVVEVPVARETPENETKEPAVAQDSPVEPPAVQASDPAPQGSPAAKSPSQMLQDLYARRRQMMEQEHQRSQQQQPRP